jgi:hypothetical protein
LIGPETDVPDGTDAEDDAAEASEYRYTLISDIAVVW